MEFLLTFFCVTIVALCSRRLVRAMFLRLRFMHKVKKICALKGYSVRRTRWLFASFFRASKKPDFIVSADREYCVRFITTIKKNRIYHFLDAVYAGSHSKMVMALPLAKGVNEFICAEKFHYLPPFADSEKTAIPEGAEMILLFNPVPAQVLAVDNEGTRIYTVTNGSRIGDFTAYGGRAFCDLLEGYISHGEQKETVGSRV